MKIINLLSSIKLIVLLAIATLIPFLLLSLFNNPATDDFYFAFHSKTSGLLNAPYWMYNNVGGRYFSNTLLCFNPVYFDGFYWFKILPNVLILFFVFSIYQFISSILINFSKSEKKAISSLLILTYFIQLPEACSAFYWMPGAITNQLPISLNLLFYTFLIKFYNTKKYRFLLLSIVFLIFTMGCNEITIIFNLLLLYFILLYRFLLLKRIDIGFIIIVFLATLFALIEFMAPGNIVRANEIPVSHDIFFSIIKSVQNSVIFLIKWAPLVVLFSIFFIDSINNLISNLKNKNYFIKPIYALLILLGILFFGLFPGYYVNRNILPDRTLNNLYFYFYLAFLYFIICCLYYLKNKKIFELSINNSSKIILGIIIILSTFSNTPIFSAYHELLNGKAYLYNVEMKNRFKLIKSSDKKKVLVPSLKNQPSTLFQPIIMGITTDIKDWKNEEISDFYEKEIIVIPTDSTFTE